MGFAQDRTQKPLYISEFPGDLQFMLTKDLMAL
jgi:hypothetical protein